MCFFTFVLHVICYTYPNLTLIINFRNKLRWYRAMLVILVKTFI